MIGLAPTTKTTKLTLHELGGSGRVPDVTKVSIPGTTALTTRDVPMPLVKNLLALHESAAPGSVKEFAKSMFKVGLMEEILTDSIAPISPLKRQDPERIMQAFYSASFLQNEEAHECLVYSSEGKVVGMAQIGRFAPRIQGLSCTISNLVLSPKLDSASQGAVIRHVASTAKERLGEATLLTSEPWGSAYGTHGFSIERAGLPSSDPRDPIGASLMRTEGGKQDSVVRCRWSG